MTNWKRSVGQHLRHLTPDDAEALLGAIRAEGITIFHPTIRKLTGGYNSQSINHYVVQKLAIRAGIIKGE
jgi:hypothetical protein